MRQTVGLILAITMAGLLHAPQARGMGDKTKFVLAQLRYRGGNWNPRPTAPRRLIWEVIKRTSVDAELEPVSLAPRAPELFHYPLLYMAGDEAFEPFSKEEVQTLREYLRFGGTLIIDNAIGRPGGPFEACVQRELKRVFPDLPLEPLPFDHTVFQTFYLMREVPGRTLGSAQLLGITQEDRTLVIYCGNDLGGAWAKDSIGNWEFDVVPGGERQRELAFRMGVNLVMYALCCNYKRDQVHIPFILGRRRRR
ncbi:MAG: DUF4159 domain-containing protein [Planctomycetes bacterium]|nr:DUF4159 domain-containing protein [Planctomycetota bacterium]